MSSGLKASDILRNNHLYVSIGRNVVLNFSQGG